MEYWQEYGFCGWGEGILWIVNPADYTDILAAWLRDTPFENNDNYYVIARSAFGELIVWGEKSGQSISINVNFGMIFPTDDTVNLEKRGQEHSIDLFFSSNSKDGLEEDLDENPLFERAMVILGPLEADEMYGFVSALAIGGAPKLENLQKVKVIEHLTFLADLGEKTVMADIVALSNALHK
ncbi:GAD-like domain-containing protein [Shewanella sp. YLB-07]|uniref:GAD-like domain-containing protein n=1 Tax=Shewanella sp. YLB-07 TaxID=2601268 RepID=UPI001D149DF4|nr:GAD-like domain-containing protein [Shewanella sp. YLB-07]